MDRKTYICRKLFKAFEWAGQGFPCRISTSEASEVEQAREAAGVAWAVQESLSLVGFRRAKPPSWSRRGKKTVGLAWTGQGLPEQFFRRAKPPSWGGRTKQLGWHGLGKGSLVDFRRAKPPSWSGSDERSSELNRAKELAGLAWAGQEFPRRIPTSKASKLGGRGKQLGWHGQARRVPSHRISTRNLCPGWILCGWCWGGLPSSDFDEGSCPGWILCGWCWGELPSSDFDEDSGEPPKRKVVLGRAPKEKSSTQKSPRKGN